MKMVRKGLTTILFFGAMLLAAGFYGILMTVAPEGSVSSFFCGRGWYQHASVLFFFFGLLLTVAKCATFQQEGRSLNMPVPAKSLTPEEAAVLSEKMPSKYRATILGKRLADLLRGYSRGEDVGPLLDRLADNDRVEVERSSSLLGWVRSMPSVFGLLGTLDGLRGGISQISRVSHNQDLEQLRKGLQDFATHSSTAFDTTLLGISCGMLLSVGIFLLGKSQEDLMGKVDEVARQLARRFTSKSRADEELQTGAQGLFRTLEQTLSGATTQILEAFRTQMQEGVNGAVRGWLESWKSELSQATRQVLDQLRARGGSNADVEEALVKNGKAAVARLEAIERALAHPAPVQIKVSADNGANGTHRGAYEIPAN